MEQVQRPEGALCPVDAVVILADAAARGASVKAEAAKVVQWIEAMLRCRVTGWWGDCWLTEARQIRGVIDWYAQMAAKQGFVVPTLPILEDHALGYMVGAHRFMMLMYNHLDDEFDPEVQMMLADIVGRH